MSGRLFNRGSRVAAASTSASTTTTVIALPEYEPLSFPLSDTARRELIELANNRGAASYEAQLKDSIRHIGLSVSDLNERLRRGQDRLATVRERREEKGNSKTAEEQRLEEQIPNFENEVERLTRESERALRETIDRKAELEDETGVLDDLGTTATTNRIAQTRSAAAAQSRRRRANAATSDDEESADGADEDEEAPPVTSIIDTFRELRAKKRAEYSGLSVQQRYSLNNDYAGFKKLWHEAAAGEDGPPLPDASRWFLSNGEPDMTIASHDGQNGALDDDDDVAVSRENISINCPLTLLPMTEPYRSRKCPHTFEKAAILDYLPPRGERQCPQTGCSQASLCRVSNCPLSDMSPTLTWKSRSKSFARSRFDHEFFLDEAMKRRIQRSKQAEQNRRDMDDDDDDPDESLVFGREQQSRGSGNRAVKREKGAI
ncbi:zinc finger, ring fyve phd-type [Trichoderma arundinaceum]|uniref:Zinc finger, ring fyve phd-type n=1 Tax=Trichoderma arundinaceum TaxID=490622 RepID=A0A395NQG8_TRIAR|nr:zinc finger, ring fyve phd-type [Trichoderma arundinaceum]